MSSQEQAIAIAIIGDVHDQWEPEDNEALKHLGVDLALFVGDFGNESVDVVRTIAQLDLPKAAIMGNHDAWYSATEWGRKKCPYDRTQEDRVQQQLDLLGEAHVGYDKLDLPQLGLSVVGGRPFSWGGSSWKNDDFYQERYGVSSFKTSTAQILSAVEHTAHEVVIMIGHCGPTGLGDRAEDPCGKDWHPVGGDYGDPDFAAAIAQSQALGKTIPLVTFGHMHHRLRHTKERQREKLVISETGTVYLNSACVPRVIKTESDCLRNFSLVTLQAGQVTRAALVWVNQAFQIASEEILFEAKSAIAQSA